ncbi:MAG: AIR carboxylase family protein [Gemmatimonadales bacterium]|nr:AIR carboxylase family protein [Gemmatimonadales bacterium]
MVVFLGTSITAGNGLELEQAYPALIQQRIDSAGLPFRVVNAGESGRTSAGGLARIDWLLREPVAVLVLELGANDGLRGLDPDVLQQNLQEIVDRTRRVHPSARIVVAGMEGALASVVGGLVDCPVIAVPTSVGYGACFEGLAALLTMLNSCASGVTVVNIDNGFSAGYAASLINNKINPPTPPTPPNAWPSPKM